MFFIYLKRSSRIKKICSSLSKIKRKYNSSYHILNGLINVIENINPEELKIKELLARIKSNQNIDEIILALNPTIEGETTAIYIFN